MARSPADYASFTLALHDLVSALVSSNECDYSQEYWTEKAKNSLMEGLTAHSFT
jgi:hypothetical protein